MADDLPENGSPPSLREVPASPPAPLDIAGAVQAVIDKNNRTELALLIGTSSLFILGAVSVVAALVQGQFLWTIPSAAISAFLIWPIKRIERLRNRNIAITASATLIQSLPPAAAAKEIQKLLEKLFDKERE